MRACLLNSTIPPVSLQISHRFIFSVTRRFRSHVRDSPLSLTLLVWPWRKGKPTRYFVGSRNQGFTGLIHLRWWLWWLTGRRTRWWRNWIKDQHCHKDVIMVKEMEIAKKVKRNDGLWRHQTSPYIKHLPWSKQSVKTTFEYCWFSLQFSIISLLSTNVSNMVLFQTNWNVWQKFCVVLLCWLFVCPVWT